MKTQSQKVKNILIEYGQIDRNYCIRELYITRLSAIILDLKKEGWVFMPRNENGNYYYKLISRPNPQTNIWKN